MMYILRKDIADLSQSERWAIIEIMRPYYIDAEPVVRRGLARNDEVLLLMNKDELIGFHLVGWRSIWVKGQLIQLVCIGLIGLKTDYQGSGLAGCLIRSLIVICRDWERTNQAKLFSWFLVANPVSFYNLTKLWGNAQFGYTNKQSRTYETLIYELKQVHNFSPYNDADHPFILRGQSIGTQYSPQQIENQSVFAKSKGIVVFDQLRIHEKKGDRLLVLCEVPKPEQVEQFEREIKERLDRFTVPIEVDLFI